MYHSDLGAAKTSNFVISWITSRSFGLEDPLIYANQANSPLLSLEKSVD